MRTLHNTIITLITLLALCLLIFNNAMAIDMNIFKFGEEAPIEISADSIEYNNEQERYIVKGSATLKSDQTELMANEITVDLKNNKAYARGDIRLTSPDGSLTADKLDVDLKTNFGIIARGRIFIQSENFHITGESFERHDENKYKIKNGTFTTCDGDNPSWNFSAKNIDIEVDGYAYATHPVFYLNSTPMLYMPAVLFPIKQTRQSGLLFPNIGYTTDDGTILKLPYYQVLGDSMDATVALDYQSERGIGLDNEFRYVRSKTSRGILNAHAMNEFDKDKDRWSISFNHFESISPTLTLKVDVTNISDDDYYFDFGENSGDINKEKLESTVTLTKNFTNADIQLEYSRDEDIRYDDAAGDFSTTNQQFPKLTGSLYRSSIGGAPLYYSGLIVFNNFVQKSYEEFTYLKLEPKLSTDFNLGRYATISSEATGVKARFWLHDNDSRSYDDHESFVAGVKASTQISRVYATSESVKLRHLIKPELEYEYVPKIDIYEDYFAFADIPEEKNVISLKLINRLNSRRDADGITTYSEPLRFEIKQGYDLYEVARELDGADDKRTPLEPLYIDAIITASQYLSLNATIYYDHYYPDHAREYNTTLNTRDTRGDRLSVNYTYLKEVDQFMQSDLNVYIGRGVSMSSTIRYDFLSDDFLEQTYGVDLAMQCWGMSFKYTEDQFDNKVFLFFSLKGIGETKEFELSAR